MYKIDYHSHSHFSYDGHNTVDEMCRAAINAGVSEIALTDHYDIDGMIEKYYTPYDEAAAYTAVQNAKEKYCGKLNIIYGIELGQPHAYPKEAEAFLKRRNFDFVIGSVHNLVNVPDFYYLNFETMPDELIEWLFDRYIVEMNLLLDFGHFDTVAHLTYPVRYIKRGGRSIDLTKYYERFMLIFERIMKADLCLEVNSSGIRQGLGSSVPDYDILKLYYEAGGRNLTIGSDAHFCSDVGADIENCCVELKKIGFSGVNSFLGGRHIVEF